jgi:hypothetical protein
MGQSRQLRYVNRVLITREYSRLWIYRYVVSMIMLRPDRTICVALAANPVFSAKAKNFWKYSCNIDLQYSTMLLEHVGMTYRCSP